MMDHRLRAARAQLVLQHPFLGALLLRREVAHGVTLWSGMVGGDLPENV